MSSQPFCAAVDWGTSRIRLWLLSRDGAALAESRGDEGMLHCQQFGFAAALDKHLSAVGADAQLPTIVCGMAGARRGWREAPYLDAPAPLAAIVDATVRIDGAARDIRILPGVARRQVAAPNVMRGEETQLLGAIGATETATVCMPGTHCKWVVVEDGAIVQFSTAMTGELFDVLRRHSILRQSLEDAGFGPSHPAFRRAVARGLENPSTALTALFEVRAAQLLSFESEADGAAHLSGLLIGAEVGAARGMRPGAPVTLVASGGLAGLYRAALELGGATVSEVDADEAARRGLFAAAKMIWG